MEERKEWLDNLNSSLSILSIFSVADMLEALILNDTEKLKAMREFYSAQVAKISGAEKLNDEDLKTLVCSYKRERFDKNRTKKEYTVKDGEAKISWIQKRRGKK